MQETFHGPDPGPELNLTLFPALASSARQTIISLLSLPCTPDTARYPEDPENRFRAGYPLLDLPSRDHTHRHIQGTASMPVFSPPYVSIHLHGDELFSGMVQSIFSNSARIALISSITCCRSSVFRNGTKYKRSFMIRSPCPIQISCLVGTTPDSGRRVKDPA
jgi:hypothetical protein